LSLFRASITAGQNC